jgi:hypothetical protein
LRYELKNSGGGDEIWKLMFLAMKEMQEGPKR